MQRRKFFSLGGSCTATSSFAARAHDRWTLYPLLLALLCVASHDARAQADPAKVLRAAFRFGETGFDPQVTPDLMSMCVNRVLFDAPFRYDFLARPHKVVPNTAVALPEGSKDGKEWTIRIKPGIYFIDDPVFNGKKRELTAADYAYSWKRIVDPRTRSAQLELFNGRIAGMDKLVDRAKETGRFDYDAPVDGLTVVDKYTLKLKLNDPWWDIASDLTSSTAGAVAREVVEAYGDASGWVMAHPVGTGPYTLKEWRRGQRIVLEANKDYRGMPFAESSDPVDKLINAHMKGKKLPLIGRVEILIMEESRTRALAFEKGDLDYVEVPGDLVPSIMDPDNTLKPRFAKAGVLLERGVPPWVSYTFFNMEDPVVGGYTKEKIALRRAIGMAYNLDDESLSCATGRASLQPWSCHRAFPVTIRRSLATRRTTRKPRRHSSTSSATSTVTRMAGAIFPTARPSC